jgi:hypothetical protein
MGEGAATLVMEERDHAIARGAHIYAEVLGYACNNDAYHMLAPRPDASVAVRCIRDALTDAQLAPDAIGYINAHATGTPLGDKAEALAIRQVFGPGPGQFDEAVSRPRARRVWARLVMKRPRPMKGVFAADKSENRQRLDCIPKVDGTRRLRPVE